MDMCMEAVQNRSRGVSGMGIDPDITHAAVEKLAKNMGEPPADRPLEWSEKEYARRLLAKAARISAAEELATSEAEKMEGTQ